MTKISVIIPYFNRQQYIERAVESVLQQELADLEIIIVDDGSVIPLESQKQILPILHDPRISLIAQTNGGPSSARNTGLDAARGEYMLFLDSDDYLELGALKKLANLLEDNNVFGAIGHWRNFNSSGVLNETAPAQRYDDALATCLIQNWVVGCILLRTDKTCRFNSARMPWEVTEFYLDYFRNKTRRVSYLGSIVVHVRQDSTHRLSTQFDHFDAGISGQFWSDMKDRLQTTGDLSFERASSLDFNILANVHELMRASRLAEAKALITRVSWALVNRYDWYHFGSFAWFCKCCGIPLGANLFFTINRTIGRM